MMVYEKSGSAQNDFSKFIYKNYIDKYVFII